jgi:epoxide hydrolase
MMLGMPEAIEPFTIGTHETALADLRSRLRRTRWPERETVGDWSQGVPLDYLQGLCRYWADGYDWPAAQARLNQIPQFTTTIDGLDIHFLHVRSADLDAVPLLMTHGWLGSFLEFAQVLGPLAGPQGHGHGDADTFHLVVPSLPGYAFSGKPAAAGWDIHRIARAWAELMTRLGYQRFLAEGSDWGTCPPAWRCSTRTVCSGSTLSRRW